MFTLFIENFGLVEIDFCKKRMFYQIRSIFIGTENGSQNIISLFIHLEGSLQFSSGECNLGEQEIAFRSL